MAIELLPYVAIGHPLIAFGAFAVDGPRHQLKAKQYYPWILYRVARDLVASTPIDTTEVIHCATQRCLFSPQASSEAYPVR